MTKQEFYNTYCKYCSCIRCSGPGDEISEGCPYFVDWEEGKEIFLPEYESPNFISNDEEIEKIF